MRTASLQYDLRTYGKNSIDSIQQIAQLTLNKSILLWSPRTRRLINNTIIIKKNADKAMATTAEITAATARTTTSTGVISPTTATTTNTTPRRTMGSHMCNQSRALNRLWSSRQEGGLEKTTKHLAERGHHQTMTIGQRGNEQLA